MVNKDFQYRHRRQERQSTNCVYSWECGSCNSCWSVHIFSRNFGIRRSSVGRTIQDLRLICHPQIQKKSVANVFWCSVATQPRWNGKICMRLEASNMRILCAKNLWISVQVALSNRRKSSRHFWGYSVEWPTPVASNIAAAALRDFMIVTSRTVSLAQHPSFWRAVIKLSVSTETFISCRLVGGTSKLRFDLNCD